MDSNPEPVAEETHMPVWLVILVVLVFPPLGWYFMYRDRRFHSWFAILIWLFAIPLVFIFASLGVVVLPKLNQLYQQFNAPHLSQTWWDAIIAVLIGISLVEIGTGVLVWRRSHETEGVSKHLLWLSIGILILNSFISSAAGYLFASMIYPIYNTASLSVTQTHQDSVVSTPALLPLTTPALWPTSIPSIISPDLKPIHAGQIALIEGDIVSLLDTDTMVKTQLPLPKLTGPQTITFSHDGNTLFTGDGEQLLIYNLKTQQTLRRDKLDPNPRVPNTDSVSPNDKYFVFIQSCCPGDSGVTIMDFSGKIVWSGGGNAYTWSPTNTQLALGVGETTLDLPFGPPPADSSLYLVSIENSSGSAKRVLQSTNQLSYSPIHWLDDHTLLYSVSTFSEPIPDIDVNNQAITERWVNVYEHPTVSYFTLNTSTLQSSPAQYKPPAYTPDTYSPDKKWRVTVESDHSIFGKIYIVSADGSQKFKIGDDGLAVWRP